MASLIYKKNPQRSTHKLFWDHSPLTTRIIIISYFTLIRMIPFRVLVIKDAPTHRRNM